MLFNYQDIFMNHFQLLMSPETKILHFFKSILSQEDICHNLPKILKVTHVWLYTMTRGSFSITFLNFELNLGRAAEVINEDFPANYYEKMYSHSGKNGQIKYFWCDIRRNVAWIETDFVCLSTKLQRKALTVVSLVFLILCFHQKGRGVNRIQRNMFE